MRIGKMITAFGILMVSAALLSGTALADEGDVRKGGKYIIDNLEVDSVDYYHEEIDNAIDDVNKLIALGDYKEVAEYIDGIASEDLAVSVMDYLGVYYPVVYTAVVSNDDVTINVEYLGSFMGKDADGNPIKDDVSVALYNTMTAYKAGLISDIKWRMSGKDKSYTVSLPGVVLDSNKVEKTINGEGNVSFGLVVSGAYFAEDDEPVITTDITLNNKTDDSVEVIN